MATAVKQLDEAAIMAVLEMIPDPEIPVLTITDLGIVRGIRSDPARLLRALRRVPLHDRR